MNAQQPATDNRATAPLDRRLAVPALIGRHDDFLFVAGLGGAAYDLIALTGDGHHVLPLAGAMGAACAMGLGLALAQPKRRVVVVTGDGELLMNVGSLATIGVAAPANLSVICVDNGLYLETGGQQSHTSQGVDVEIIARGSGFKLTRTVSREDQIAEAHALLHSADGPYFVRLCVGPGDPPEIADKPYMNGAVCRARFRAALLGT